MYQKLTKIYIIREFELRLANLEKAKKVNLFKGFTLQPTHPIPGFARTIWRKTALVKQTFAVFNDFRDSQSDILLFLILLPPFIKRGA